MNRNGLQYLQIIPALQVKRRFVPLLLIALGCISISADEQTVVITAKPKFEQREKFTRLLLIDANRSFYIDSNVQFVPGSLDTNKVYSFTITQRPFHISELRKVQLDRQTIYDIETCEVHHAKMEYKEVQIAYGLILPQSGDPSADTERRMFPHRHEYLPGGCVISPDSPKTEKVYVCGECKEAFEWWSGTAKVPFSVLPRDTRYDHDQVLRLAYLEYFGKGYVAAWARKEVLPIFGPTTEEDKARVFGYSDGVVAGRSARDAWSGAQGQRYGPRKSTPPGR